MFPVFIFVENPFHGILLDITEDIDFGMEPGQSVCVGEGIDDPLIYAAKEKAGIEAANVFGGKDFDVGV